MYNVRVILLNAMNEVSKQNRTKEKVCVKNEKTSCVNRHMFVASPPIWNAKLQS